MSNDPADGPLNQATVAGLRAIFFWGVFPFPFGLIATWILSPIPVIGFVAKIAAAVIVVMWLTRAVIRWGGGWGDVLSATFDVLWRRLLDTLRRPEPRAFARLAAVNDIQRPQWVTPPINSEHQTYRMQYERVVDVLAGLSRDGEGDGKENRRKTFLFLAEVLDALHIYGDDPIASPSAPQALFALPKPALLFGGPLHWWAIGALILVGGWEKVRADRSHLQAERAVADLTETTAVAEELHRRLAIEASARTVAQNQLEIAAETIAARETIIRRARANERRIQHAQAAINDGAPVDWGSLMLPPAIDGSLDGGPAPAGAAASDHPV